MNKILSLASRLLRIGQAVVMVLSLLFISACSSMNSTPRISLDANGSWALLPIQNLSETPQADQQAKVLIETQLRARGISLVAAYAPMRPVSLSALLDSSAEMEDARQWALQSGYRYSLSGSVHEWQYKAGADLEPAVGLGLKLTDLRTNTVIWQGNAAQTGWGYDTLQSVASSVIKDLLKQIELDGSSR